MDLIAGVCVLEVGYIAINWVWFCFTLTWDGENFLIIFDFQPHPQAPLIVAQAGREPGISVLARIFYRAVGGGVGCSYLLLIFINCCING